MSRERNVRNDLKRSEIANREIQSKECHCPNAITICWIHDVKGCDQIEEVFGSVPVVPPTRGDFRG